jgi:hypothetical protein
MRAKNGGIEAERLCFGWDHDCLLAVLATRIQMRLP